MLTCFSHGKFQSGVSPRDRSLALVTVFDDGQVSPRDVPKLNLRDRQRHDPGSGPYTNRWVFANEAQVIYNNQRALSSFSYPFSAGRGTRWKDLLGEEYWDGIGYGYISLRVRYNTTLTKVDLYYVSFYHYVWNAEARTASSITIAMKADQHSRQFNAGSNPDAAKAAAYADYATWHARLHWSFDSIIASVRKATYRIYPCNEVPESLPKFSSRPTYYADAIDLNLDEGRQLNSLIADAYVDMLSHLPDASGMGNAVNAIQFATAGLNAIRGLMSRDVGVTIGSVSDAWLAYRYSYSTTKADLTEAASLLSRAAAILGSPKIRSNGSARLTLSDGSELLARSSLELDVSELSSLKSTIERFGLQLDGYAMWDLVPYSFIADWFLGVGDRLEFAREKNFALRLRNRACWCSIERKWTNEYGFPEIYYHRFLGYPAVPQATFHSKGASGITIVKRALDVLALFAS